MSIVGLRAFASPIGRDLEHIERLAGLRTTDLSDGMQRSGTMSGIRSITEPALGLLGFAVTVSVPAGGFDIIKVGLELCRPGDVLVVSARGDTLNALWGGNLSLGAQSRGLAGFVIDGAVRDIEEISELEFPVFARATAVSAGAIQCPYGEVNVPIACGGVVVNPGDLVVGDRDGIVVIRPDDVVPAVAATRKVLAGHVSVRSTLEAGEVTSRESILARLSEHGLTMPVTT